MVPIGAPTPTGVACSRIRPRPLPPPPPAPSGPPKVFEPVFLQFKISGKSAGAEFCGEFENG